MTKQIIIDNDLADAISFLSDMYKDAYGFRPRGIFNYEVMTLEDVQREIDKCSVIISDNMVRERIEEMNAEWRFKALVDKTINLGAGDEKTALKWLFDAYVENPNDVDYFEFESFLYHNGIMHTNYGKYVENIIKNLI